MPVRPSELIPDAAWTLLAGRTQLRLTGRDRAPFLHNFCTNDIKTLQPGQGCEAFLTNIKGRIVGHINVFVEPDSIIVDSVPGCAASLAAHLDRYLITEDVTVADESDSTAVMYLFGRGIFDALHRIAVSDVAAMSLGQHVQAAIGGQTGSLRRIDFTSAPGFEFACSRARSDDAAGPLEDAGFERISTSGFDALRIDAGYPWAGIDVGEENLAQEASRTARAISFAKGCYLGQEPIARLDALGHVNKELRIIVFDPAVEVAPGVELIDPENSTKLGILTSAARFEQSDVVGLAVLKTSAAPGGRVAVAGHPEGRGTVVAIA